MAEFTDTLTDKHIAFIEKQPVYFTATAAADARINLSPKEGGGGGGGGYADSFRDPVGTGRSPISTLAGRATRHTRTSPPTAASRSCSAPSIAVR